jgi:hypothetical protein
MTSSMQRSVKLQDRASFFSFLLRSPCMKSASYKKSTSTQRLRALHLTRNKTFFLRFWYLILELFLQCGIFDFSFHSKTELTIETYGILFLYRKCQKNWINFHHKWVKPLLLGPFWFVSMFYSLFIFCVFWWLMVYILFLSVFIWFLLIFLTDGDRTWLVDV